MALRVTPTIGQPVPQRDAIGATRIYYSDIGIAGPYLDLAGRPGGVVYDLYRHLVSGDLLTEVAPSMEVKLTGTPIGGMVASGGLAAAFDGNLNKPYVNCAKSPGAVTGYCLDGAVGIGLSSPQIVNRIAITAPNDNAFLGSNASTPWQLLGGSGGNYAAASFIADGLTPPFTASPIGRIELDFPNGVAYDSIWWNGFGNGGNAIRVCQVELFSTLPMSARGLTSAMGLTVNDHVMTATGNSGPIICSIGDCEFIGQLQIDPGGGAVTFHKSSGPDRRCGYWNAKNQVPLRLKVSDPNPPASGHFSYAPLASPDYQFSVVRGSGLIRATFLNGLADNDARATFDQAVFQNDGTANTAYWCGVNASKNTPAGKWGLGNIDSTGDLEGCDMHAGHIFAPFYGSKTVYALEGARGPISAFYGEGNQDLIVEANF